MFDSVFVFGHFVNIGRTFRPNLVNVEGNDFESRKFPRKLSILMSGYLFYGKSFHILNIRRC